jgi:hypothetical protein
MTRRPQLISVLYVSAVLFNFLFLQTGTAQATFLPGFDFTLSQDSYWEYYWSYEKINYDQDSGAEKTTDTGNFRLELGPPITIDGIAFYPITVQGKTNDPEFDYNPRWNYLALHNGQLLGSVDGVNFNIIFDANTGQWLGGGFFTSFSSDREIEAKNDHISNEWIDTSAISVGRSESQDRCDNFLVAGNLVTICAGDEQYTLIEKEYYKGGIGPIGHYAYFSSSDDGAGLYTSVKRTRHLGLVATSHTANDGFTPHLPPWTEVAPLPEVCTYNSSTVANDKIYVFSGNNCNSVFEYDPKKDTWSKVASMPESSWGHKSQYYNGNIYLFGGNLTRVWAYNPLANLWFRMTTALPDQITDKYILSAAIDQYFLTFTSNGSAVPTYIAGDDTWDFVTPLPLAHYWPGVCESPERIYYLGGYEVGYNYSVVSKSTCQEFNPFVPYGSDEAWTNCTFMPTPRHNVICEFFEGKVFAIGGEDNSKDALRTVEVYDPATNSWSEEKSTINKRFTWSSSAAVVNGRLYVIGQSSVEMFTPPDSDGDGLSDYVEQNSSCLDYQDSDSDDDGLADGLEDQNYDGFWNYLETNPCNPDTDGDGLEDGDEADYWGPNWDADPDADGLVNLLDPDSDNDGLNDGVEVILFGTNPSLADTDGNGFTDAEEIQCDSDPVDPNSRCNRLLPFLMLLLD